ncbi:MAG TPA: DUF2950 family protein [Bryobacteraceae bacterium]|nr:DUF2950 family protein [Bryobacteraceae bacterium]
MKQGIMKQGMINMMDRLRQTLFGRARSATVPIALLALWTTSGAYPGQAQQSRQPTYPSAADATQSLFQSVQSNNEQAIANILGGPTELTSSRDAGQDQVDRELFAQKYQEMHRLRREADGSVMLYIGAENWPFPVPLVNENGAWRFDPDAGQKEVLFRRIGENEITAVATCHEFVDSAKHYHAGSSADPADSVPASLVAKAASGSGSSDPVLFHGYYFRLLRVAPAKGTMPHGFALMAYPAEYRSSGVMTFIVKENGVVYEKDFGANTSTLAGNMAAFHKDSTWRPTTGE